MKLRQILTALSPARIRQRRLQSIYEYLLYDNPMQLCFYCHKPIFGDPVLHHVIPYYMVLSDDLWNIVLTHPHCRQQHEDAFPTFRDVRKLEQRNRLMYEEFMKMEMKEPLVSELAYAIRMNSVQWYYNRYAIPTIHNLI